MDKGLIVAIIAAVVAVAAFLYARSLKPPTAETSTLSMGQALGAGILGLGILLLAMPWAAGEISQLGFITSSDFGILSGSVYAIGILALLGGLAILIARNAPEA
jgi:peptidoglycan biosynthesis protein MviN/MurJ (putative lipid II flippase)